MPNKVRLLTENVACRHSQLSFMVFCKVIMEGKFYVKVIRIHIDMMCAAFLCACVCND